jgi:hypothetical protein
MCVPAKYTKDGKAQKIQFIVDPAEKTGPPDIFILSAANIIRT